MTKIRRSNRVSKQHWLSTALEVFIQKGEPGVNIELLAREIGVAKSGFYWHFKDRADLLGQLLDYWSHEYTEVITTNVTIQALPAADRLLKIMEMIEEHDLAGLDLHFHVWARKDVKVARHVQKVIRERLDYLMNTFAELGFGGDELEMRARLFLAYEANESLIFRFKTRGQVKRLRQRRWRHYLRLPQDKSPSS